MSTKKRILLKLTGEVFLDKDGQLDKQEIENIAQQLSQLSKTHIFGIVVGGGNFFRGHQHGKKLGLSESIGHKIGMLGTIMNGYILQDILANHHLNPQLFCATPNTPFGSTISHESIWNAINNAKTLLFSGGTGNPFFTTDTTAILRGLQMKVDEVWKGTKVDGIYSADPKKDPTAQKFTHLTYDQALEKNLQIMDLTAFAMGKQYHQRVRVFDIFSKDALIHAAHTKDFGTILT